MEGEERKVEGKRKGRQGSEAETASGREGGRAEDTAAMKPVICQISHGRAHIHIMSLNSKKNNVKQYRRIPATETMLLTKLMQPNITLTHK